MNYHSLIAVVTSGDMAVEVGTRDRRCYDCVPCAGYPRPEFHEVRKWLRMDVVQTFERVFRTVAGDEAR